MKTSRPSDTALAEAHRRAARRPGWPTPDCPPLEDLGRLATGDARGDQRARLADHLITCTDCAALVRDLRQLEPWAERAAEHRPRRPRWPLALAALLLTAIAAGWLWTALRPDPTHPPDPLRGPGDEIHPAAAAVLDQPPTTFTWPPRTGATAYRVELRDATGERLWQGDWVTDPATEMPPTVADALPAGVYSWRVETRGQALGARLGPFTFVVQARSPGAPSDH